MNFKYNRKLKRNVLGGFTLVEALVAIAIFSISVLALMTVLADSVASTNYAKRKLIAAYLAQEGIEYFRNIRDTYVLYQDPLAISDGWSDFKVKMSVCDSARTEGCYFDDQNLDYASQTRPIINIDVNECYLGKCPEMLYDSVSGKYGYASGDVTDFVRKMSTENISDDEIKIVSTVFWTQGSGTYAISFSENLFNWTK